MAGYQQLYDIAELPTYSAAPAGNDQAQAGDAWSRMAAVYQTSKQAAAHTGSFNSETLASQDAAQKRVDSIFKATGVRLANPYNASPLLGDEIDNPQAHEDDRAALKAFAADHPDYQPGKVLDFDQQSKLDPYRKRAFQQRLQDLQRDFPEHAAVIQADRPIEGAAIDLAGQSAANAARAYQSGPGGGLSFLSSLAGGLIASFRDPVQVAALALGGGEIKAVSTVGRIAEGAIRQGAVNAGIAAIEQPSVQDWRARVGLETGVLPAAEDVGLAFLFGAIPGGALAPFHGGNPARAREGAQNLADALRGDARAVQRATEVLPRDVAPELHAAAESNTLDRAAAPPLPEHLSPETAAPLQRDGVRFAEDPLNDPLPDAFTGGTAERTLALSDAARAMVERGEVEPHVALTVPGLVLDPAGHAAMLQRLQEASIRDADQARLFISRELDAANMRDAQGAVLGSDPAATIPETGFATVADRGRQAQAMEQGLFGAADSEKAPVVAAVGETPKRAFDAVPVADRVDGSDMRTVARDDLRTAQPRENDLADLVDLCKF